MHSFAERQKPTHADAYASLSVLRARRGLKQHTPPSAEDAPLRERASSGFDLTRVPVTPSPVMRKPLVSSPADVHEREADEAADEVMRASAPSSSRGATADARGGAQMPGEVRAFFESRFGQDFGSVRLHHDGAAAESAKALDARAYTVGRDVVFGAGEYSPHTHAGRRLLAHELAHVVQQRGPLQGTAAGASGHVGRVGDAPRLSPLSSPSIQRQTAAPSAQTAPKRATTSDEYARYQAAQEEMERFRAGAPYFLHNYKPPTGRGFFDAMYYPPNLNVTVKVRFFFIDSDLDWWHKNGAPKATQPDVEWTEAQRQAWRQQYLTDVSAKWSNQNYMLYCTRPWWESLTAQVVVRFVDADAIAPAELGLGKGDIKSHFDLIVKKIPPGQSLQSFTGSPTGKSTTEGTVTLNSEGLKSARNESGQSQRSAVHESAHMLGLGDTYVPEGRTAQNADPASHADLVKKELGVATPIKDDARLTSRGEKMDLSDAVTFLEAVRATTKIPDWALKSKPAATVPNSPKGAANDAAAPREKVV